MTRVSCPSALGLMDNAQDIVLIRDFRKCEKYLTLPIQQLIVSLKSSLRWNRMLMRAENGDAQRSTE